MKKKDSFYFSHDMDARHDPKILKMETVYEYGYGWYFKIVEILRAQSDYRYKIDKYCWNAIASDLHMQNKILKKFIEDCIKEFDLFQSDGEYFWSDSLLERMEIKDKKSQIYAENAKKRWGNKSMQLHSKPDAIAEHKSKLKESKIKESISIPFSSFWDSYGKKVGDKTKLEKKWNKLSDEDRKAIMDYIPAYIKATPDKKYRKNPETFLNNHSWNDEIVEYAHKPGPPDLRELAISKVESNVKAMITHPERFNKYNPFDDAAQSIISHLPDVKGFDYTGLKYVLINLIETKYREEVKNAVKGIPA